MDFMLRDDSSLQKYPICRLQFTGLWLLMSRHRKEDYEGYEAYVPRVGYRKSEIFRYQDTDIKKLFAELWTKVKAQ